MHYMTYAFGILKLKLLVDTIQSSKFITEKKSNTMTKKLETFIKQWRINKYGRNRKQQGLD